MCACVFAYMQEHLYVCMHACIYLYLHSVRKGVVRPWIKHKDELKSNLSVVNVPHANMVRVDLGKNNWSYLCLSSIRNIEISRIDRLRSNIPVAMTQDARYFTKCAVMEEVSNKTTKKKKTE